MSSQSMNETKVPDLSTLRINRAATPEPSDKRTKVFRVIAIVLVTAFILVIGYFVL
jgi:hypothetical protein